MEIEWHVPEVWNAFERNRGAGVLHGLHGAGRAQQLDGGDGPAQARRHPHQHAVRDPQAGRAASASGFWGAGRGYLTHHLVLDRGAVANYQIVTPSTWNASPSDRWRQPGPYEEAVLNTPLLEETDDPKQFKGIDILRAIRSFDPCMPCTTHIHSDAGVITREVNTCACGVDDDGG